LRQDEAEQIVDEHVHDWWLMPLWSPAEIAEAIAERVAQTERQRSREASARVMAGSRRMR
jgi:hypothetical protein